MNPVALVYQFTNTYLAFKEVKKGYDEAIFLGIEEPESDFLLRGDVHKIANSISSKFRGN